MTMQALVTFLSLASLHQGPGLLALQAPGSSCDSTASLPPSVPADSVDARPSLAPPYPSLRYPFGPAMAGVTGDVLIEYDVDSTGAVDHCSIRIIVAKRPEFAASAKAFVTRLRFTPGLKNGAVVRTRVQQRIRFQKRNGDRGKHHLF